jgi:catechol 2,3-dioxygenase-like lactoylglutathione lyase family enzyme
VIPSLIPELCVQDMAAATDLLTRTFGFSSTPHANRLALGPQIVELRQEKGAAGHGAIDHLALAVDDLDAALSAALARGAALDPAVTPDGPLFIPEFWVAGTRYVFLSGPEGARIEFCARPGIIRHDLPGHDHIGIPCRDLPAMRAFFLSLGLAEIAAVTLTRPEGDIPVAFLGIGASVVELYQPVTPPNPSPRGHWRRLILERAGAREDAGEVAGPEGLTVLRRP